MHHLLNCRLSSLGLVDRLKPPKVGWVICRSLNIFSMTVPLNKGLTINSIGHRQYLELGKLYRGRRKGWYGVAYNWAKDESFRVWSLWWFPTGIVVVADHACDIDQYIVNELATVDLNHLDIEWLKENEPGNFKSNALQLAFELLQEDEE